MIGAKLRFIAVRGVTKRCGHDSCISDYHVEGFTLRQQSIGACSHALKIGEIERNQLEAAAVGRSLLCTSSVAAFAFAKSRAAPTTSAPCAASARPVSTQSPAETPVTRIRLPLRLIPDKTSSVVEVAPSIFTILLVSRSNPVGFPSFPGAYFTEEC